MGGEECAEECGWVDESEKSVGGQRRVRGEEKSMGSESGESEWRRVCYIEEGGWGLFNFRVEKPSHLKV